MLTMKEMIDNAVINIDKLIANNEKQIRLLKAIRKVLLEKRETVTD